MPELIREYLLKYRGRFLGSAACTTLATGFAFLTPWFLRQAIDSFAQGSSTVGWPLQAYAAAIVATAALEAVSRFGSRMLGTGASRWVEYDLRNRFFAHLERLEPSFFYYYRTGDLVARATNDLSAVRQLFGPALSNLLNTTVLVTVALVLMFQISVPLALWALLIVPGTGLLFAFTRARIGYRFTQVQEQFGVLSDHAQETFAGQRVVKAFAQEKAEIESFREASKEYVRRQLAQTRITALLWPGNTLVVGMLTVVLLWVGGREVIEGRITLGEFVQFNAYVAMLAWPIMALGWVATMWQQGSASLRRIVEVLSTEPRIDSPSASVGTPALVAISPPRAASVELRHVSLTIDGRDILRDVNLVIPAGATFAIVGPLGAGKSMLAGLIPRLYDPTEGQVLVDGVDLRDVPLSELRRMVGFVPQDTFLFSETLRENVAFGLSEPEATESRIQAAVRISQLERDLDQWPNGLETHIGERGVTLSGGQKQRAAIARAVAKEPSILVLDDALSSVDARTEEAILDGLRSFMATRTSILIAHRLSTVRDADQVVVLEGGRVAEQGTHAELVQRGGWYTRMYRRQLIAQELGVEEDDRPTRSDSDESALLDRTSGGGVPRASSWGDLSA